MYSTACTRGIETSGPKLVNRPVAPPLSLQETTRSGGKSVLGKAVRKRLENRALDGR